MFCVFIFPWIFFFFVAERGIAEPLWITILSLVAISVTLPLLPIFVPIIQAVTPLGGALYFGALVVAALINSLVVALLLYVLLLGVRYLDNLSSTWK
jgi:hypothetical protein